MSEANRQHRLDIDILKGIAILAIIIYHMGFLPHGYLGVDVFLVINGFLIIPSVYKKMEEGNFNYFSFLKKRFLRLAPMVVLACTVSMLVGLIGMLPDDYENLAESSVASLLFSNNILSSLIAADYWNVVNDYKPLMHLWYVGVLAEFYLFLPLVVLVDTRIKSNKTGIVHGGGVCIVTILSLVLFLYPEKLFGDKFYLLPCRFFEFGFGGLCALYFKKRNNFGHIFALLVIVLTLLLPSTNFENIFLLVTVFSTVIVLGTNTEFMNNVYKRKLFLPLQIIGKASYSIFIFHQIILAFYRYYFSQTITVSFICIFIILLVLFSLFGFLCIERKVPVTNQSLLITISFAILVCIPSFWVYMHAGVVRDVPELGVYKNNVHRNMHAEYVDRIYGYDKDFSTTDNVKILCIGNSFARDWANILLESEYSDLFDISYSFYCSENIKNRINKADFIFVYLYKTDLPDWFWDEVQNIKCVYGIGNKSFGSSNGIIYVKRFSKNYFDTTIKIVDSFVEENMLRKNQWKENYIDMLSPVTMADEKVRVFTDENKFISQDCAHLTKYGAQFYAKILDISKYTNR